MHLLPRRRYVRGECRCCCCCKQTSSSLEVRDDTEGAPPRIGLTKCLRHQFMAFSLKGALSMDRDEMEANS